MTMRTVSTLLLMLCLALTAVADLRMATIDGNAYLEDQSDHSGIKVLFQGTSPSATTDSVYTDTDGYYAIGLTDGIYSVEYSLPDYITHSSASVTFSGSSQTLSDVTLAAGQVIDVYADTVSGVWASGSLYRVHGDLLVDSNDTLVIEPGVRVKFMGYYQLEVRGYLHAIGAPGDSIYFESGRSNISNTDWKGLAFTYSNYRGLLQYCSVKHAAKSTSGSDGAINIGSNTGNTGSTDSLNFVLRILNTSVSQNGNVGIYVNSSNTEIDSCDFSSMGAYNIYVNDYSSNMNCKITNNNFKGDNNYLGGVRFVSHSSNNLIKFSGNRLSDFSYPIQFYYPNEHTMIENNVILGGNYGIEVNGYPTIRNNLISESNNGIILTPNSGGLIENNIFSRCSKDLNFYGEHSATIRYNDFSSSTPSNRFQNPQYAPDGLGQLITLNANGDSVDTYFNIYQNPAFAPDDTARAVEWSLVDSIVTMTLFPHNLWDFEDANIGQKRLILSVEPEYHSNLYIEGEGYTWSFNPYTIFDGVVPETYRFAITDGPQEPYYTSPEQLDLSKTSDVVYANYGSRLTSSSPCIDAGNPDPAYYDADGTIADIGPHPFLQDVNGPIPAPVADFSSNHQSGTSPLFVEFSSTSTGPVTGYSWNFGDGSTSTTARPVHRYSIAGDYSVSLTATGPGGSSTEIKTEYISVNSPALPPIVDFTATPRIGTTPVEVTFSSLTQNNVDSLRWLFGDGSSSVLPSPVHTYTDTGRYDVTLMAYNTHGADTLTRLQYITVLPEYDVAVDFSASPQLGIAPHLVTFQNNSVGSLDSVLWYFGDGDSSSLLNPIHSYELPGQYSVTCIAFGPLNQDTLIQGNFINVLDSRPLILEIGDVPDDQGGRVLLKWAASGYDGGLNTSVVQYSIWQLYQESWVSMGNYMANQSTDYTTILNTFSDSTIIGLNQSYFQVIAHTNVPDLFYTSPVDSGYSLDNVPPQVPSQLVANVSPESVNLEWDCYEEPQFMYYNIYRNDALVGQSSSKAFEDYSYDSHSPNFYTVTSVDEAGNESGSSDHLFVDVDNLSWWVSLELYSQGGSEDLYNFIGVTDSASTGFDLDYDYLEPPVPPGDYVSLYFPHADWENPLGSDFSQDIRDVINLSDTMQVWQFEVVSSSSDTVVLVIEPVDVPSINMIVDGPFEPRKNHLLGTTSFTWFAQADSIYEFAMSFGDSTAPSLALDADFNGPQVLISDSTYTFNWAAFDGNEVDSLWIFSSYDGGNSYSQIYETSGNPETFDWVIPDTSLLNQVLLGVTVSDYAGNTRSAFSSQPMIIAGHYHDLSIESGWSLWSAPVSLFEPSIFEEIEPDIEGYWNFFGYDGNGYTLDSLIHSGSSYWLANMDPDTIGVAGVPVSEIAQEYGLRQGWHLISTPYLVSSDVTELIFTKDSVELYYSEAIDSSWITQLYGYDGSGYYNPSLIEPWKGYWLGVSDSINLTIQLTTPSMTLAREIGQPDWALQLFGSSASATDNLMLIGVDSLAQNGFDPRFDALQPPMSPNPHHVSVYVEHPEWNNSLGDRFTSDVRNALADDEFHEWQIAIESDEQTVELGWEIAGFPEHYELGLAMDGQSPFADLRTLESIEIAVPATIVVRAGVHVLAIGEDGNLPDEYALFPNYPNPFNPTTTVRYNLPESNHVSMVVYDVRGRVVATLVDKRQVAGYHSIQWNGLNADGSLMSTGLYLCQIQAGSFTKTIKMLYLK